MQTAIDGILTNYTVLGSKTDPALLILHGWGQNSNHWVNVANLLSTKYQVILLDLPGFGGSSKPNDNFNSDNYADFVAKFIEKLKLTDLILLGHSFGGKIAIKLSSKLESVRYLLLVSPSGIPTSNILTTIKIVFVKFFKLFLFWLPNKTKSLFLSFISADDYLNAREMKPIYKNIVYEDVRPDAKNVMQKTLIVWSEFDMEVNVKNSKVLKDLIRNSNLRILWKMGHSPNIEGPEKLVNLLFEYI